MTSLSPQVTGGTNLGSRNPFLGLITPQSTGVNSTGDEATVTTMTSTTQQGGSSPSANAEAEAIPVANNNDNPQSQTFPVVTRTNTSRSGALNSSSPSGITTSPETSTRVEASAARRTNAYNPPPGPPPPPLPARGQSNITTMEPRHSERNDTLDVLTEDLPPAYTPGPNAREGEQSIEFGPIRPFQNVEPRLPTSPNAPGIYIISGPGGRGGGGRGGYRPQEQRGGTLSRMLGDMLITALTTPQAELRRNPGTLFRPNLSPNASAQSSSFASYGPFTPPPGRSMPPTSPIPPARRNWSQYPGQMNRSTTPEPQTPPANDGKPTNRPIPGHPLLRNREVLIYPPGYECNKCFNKGFRPVHASTFDLTPRALAPGDPSDPCRKCWRHYSVPYTPEIARLDWTDVVNANRQRPISEPLHQNGPPQGNANVYSQGGGGGGGSFTSPGFGPPRSSTPAAPGGPSQFAGTPQRPGPSSSPSPFSPPPGRLSRGGGSGFGGAPPGAQWSASNPQTSSGGGGRMMYSPGDSRMGGRLCVKCNGTGRVRVFILESERCNMCGGVGRVF